MRLHRARLLHTPRATIVTVGRREMDRECTNIRHSYAEGFPASGDKTVGAAIKNNYSDTNQIRCEFHFWYTRSREWKDTDRGPICGPEFRLHGGESVTSTSMQVCLGGVNIASLYSTGWHEIMAPNRNNTISNACNGRACVWVFGRRFRFVDRTCGQRGESSTQD